jgi:hypothetical protein
VATSGRTPAASRAQACREACARARRLQRHLRAALGRARRDVLAAHDARDELVARARCEQLAGRTAQPALGPTTATRSGALHGPPRRARRQRQQLQAQRAEAQAGARAPLRQQRARGQARQGVDLERHGLALEAGRARGTMKSTRA